MNLQSISPKPWSFRRSSVARGAALAGLGVAAVICAAACGGAPDDGAGEPPASVDEGAAPRETTAYPVGVKQDLRQGCADQNLRPDEARYCQSCADQSTQERRCSCSIRCTSTGAVIKMCGCSTFAGPGTAE